MIHLETDFTQAKGWFLGPWNSDLPIPIGWATQGIDEPHVHIEMNEVYLVARGHSTALVDGEEVNLNAGDILVVEPGEVHTFMQSSSDYLHFVLQSPFVKGDKVLKGERVV